VSADPPLPGQVYFFLYDYQGIRSHGSEVWRGQLVRNAAFRSGESSGVLPRVAWDASCNCTTQSTYHFPGTSTPVSFNNSANPVNSSKFGRSLLLAVMAHGCTPQRIGTDQCFSAPPSIRSPLNRFNPSNRTSTLSAVRTTFFGMVHSKRGRGLLTTSHCRPPVSGFRRSSDYATTLGMERKHLPTKQPPLFD